jgi:Arc/MetJ-type ribon-helix-helix transcriptional regulator
MNVTLPPEIARLVNDEVEAGHFPSPQALVIAAILDMRDVDEDELDDETIAAINEGLDQADRGEGMDFEAFRAQWDERLKRS